MNFTLNISLGNDAMQTPEDVGRALIELGEKLHAHGACEWGSVAALPMKDANGNTVGAWQVAEDDSDPLGDPPAHLADAWQRFRRGERIDEFEVRALDEWRAERAEADGY